jgi:hypothetical protein
MSAIVYGILTHSGTVMKRGDAVEIKNAVGMTFAIHCNERRRADDEQRFVVTNIETGMRAGWGTTREAAIDSARKRVRAEIKRGTLASTFANAMSTRAGILARVAGAPMEDAA